MAPPSFLAAFAMINFTASIFKCAKSASTRRMSYKIILLQPISSLRELILHICLSVPCAMTRASARLIFVVAEHQLILSCGYADTSSKDSGSNVIVLTGLIFRDIDLGQLPLIRHRLEDRMAVYPGIQMRTTEETLVGVLTTRGRPIIRADMAGLGIQIQVLDGITPMDQDRAVTRIRGTSSELGTWRGTAATISNSGARKLSPRDFALTRSSFSFLS